MGTVFRHTCIAITLVAMLFGLSGAPPVHAVAPVAGEGGTPLAQKLSPKQLEKLVGPIALYSDDLLAIVLPSATTPIDLVKAQRFLEKYKKDPKLKPDPSLPEWDETVDMGAKVTIDLHGVKPVDREEAERSRKEAALKKALSASRVAMPPTPAELLPLQLLPLRARGDGAEAGGRG